MAEIGNWSRSVIAALIPRALRINEPRDAARRMELDFAGDSPARSRGPRLKARAGPRISFTNRDLLCRATELMFPLLEDETCENLPW